MNITGLLALIDDLPEYLLLAERLRQGDARALITEEARPYLLAALYRRLGVPMLVVTTRADRARHLAEQLALWTDGPVHTIPEPDGMYYQRLRGDRAGELELAEVLTRLVGHAAQTPLAVVSAQALTRRLPKAAVFGRLQRRISRGEVLDPLDLMKELIRWGYEPESAVEAPGQISRRGGIIDLFPPTDELPTRIEFFGNTVDSLRVFEPSSQRSAKSVNSVTFGPSALTAPVFVGDRIEQTFAALDLSDLTQEEKDCYEEDKVGLMTGCSSGEIAFYSPLFNSALLLDYLPDNTLVVMDDPDGVQREISFVHEEAEKARSARVATHELPPNFPVPYHLGEELEGQLALKRRLLLPLWDGAGEESLNLDFQALPSYAGQLTRWIERVRDLLMERKRVLVVSHQAERLAELLSDEGISSVALGAAASLPVKGKLALLQGIVAGGWMTEGICLFTDREIFGFLKQRRQIKKRVVKRRKLYIDFRPGDYVVHVEHGIGRFGGIIAREVEGRTREYMLLAYAEGARLYVPTDQIDRVARYVGASDAPPAISRLGSLEWVKSKERARAAAEEVAQGLLNIYAARELAPGFVYSPDNTWQIEMEASFPYVETPDQLSAIAQIKEDMARPRPMDRLVTGDVGYGKTEVALRAAFKAVMDGRQVAILVPTTVLAQQHFTTFRERLAAFPVKIETLSRFRSHQEQREIIKSIAEGAVDIIVGTHRLIQKDVVFKDLGLAIIDEEQRFGVSHKEYFKRLRQEIDVLTLSATPIPRTLHMSLVGVRDMSVIETPPEERLPVKTYVAEYDENLIREAITRELERGGQVFFVHNRVRSIGMIAERLGAIIPEARIAVGHGQMDEDALEGVMADFAQNKVDVLLCTTIIESGLDVSNANTLIINQADRLGLTQLYQLRGRVGRGANLAYAYFLYDKGKRLTEDAGKRLRTIFEAAELGAGFDIAMKDLEIRGAGNILGVRQSGHINAVGFSYYTQLLAEAVDDLKAEQVATKAGQPVPQRLHLPPPIIDLPLPAFIPDGYVADSETRLSLYQNLANLRNPEAALRWGEDFKDRFGEMPPEVVNLLYAVRIKTLAMGARLSSVTVEGGDIVLRRPPGMIFDTTSLQPLVRTGIRIAPFQIRISTKTTVSSWQETLENILTRLGEWVGHSSSDRLDKGQQPV